MERVKVELRKAVAESGLTQEEIGQRMGHPKTAARAAVSQLLSKGSNPSLQTLVKFTLAIGKKLSDILSLSDIS